MNETTLRKLIREEIEAALDEVDGSSATPPKSWSEFRKAVAALAAEAGAPEQFVAELSDTDNEGEGVPVALFQHWQDFQHEPSDNPRDHWETFAYYAGDAVRSAAEQFTSAMNYAPGRRASKFNAEELANAMEKIVTSKHVFTKKS